MDASVSAEPALRDEPRQTVLLPLDRIDLGDRLRTVSEGAVTHIAESIRRHGLQNPIQVRSLNEDRYLLVAGAHRCQAMRSLGQTTIEAFVLDALTADELDLLEIDENLMRSELNALDRGRFLARRKHIHERLYPRSRPGGDRKSAEYKTAPGPKGFVAETARFTPFSPWTIRRALKIGQNITPELQDELAHSALAHREGDLYKIARMEEEEQRRVLDALREADEEPRSLAALLRPDPDDNASDDEDPTSSPDGNADEGEDHTPGADGNAEAGKTPLARFQTLWIQATEDERQEIMAWLELMKAQENGDQPTDS